MIKETSIIRSCHKLLMSQFIDCLVDKNLDVLGHGTEEELKAAWADIYSEFTSLRKSEQSSEMFELMKEVLTLDNKLKIINKCLEVLWVCYNRDIANELQMLGYQVKLDWSDKESYYSGLRSITSKAKTLSAQLKRKEQELQAITEKNKGEGYSRTHFDSINVNLSKFMEFNIREEEITVSKWCMMVNKYEGWLEVKNAEASRH